MADLIRAMVIKGEDTVIYSSDKVKMVHHMDNHQHNKCGSFAFFRILKFWRRRRLPSAARESKKDEGREHLVIPKDSLMTVSKIKEVDSIEIVD